MSDMKIVEQMLKDFDELQNLGSFLKFSQDNELEEYILSIAAASVQDIEDHIEREEDKIAIQDMCRDIIKDIVADIRIEVKETVKKLPSVPSLDLDQLSLREILKLITCKCNEMRAKVDEKVRTMERQRKELTDVMPKRELEEMKEIIGLTDAEKAEALMKEKEILEEEEFEEISGESTPVQPSVSAVSDSVKYSETDLRDPEVKLTQFVEVKDFSLNFVDDIIKEALLKYEKYLANLAVPVRGLESLTLLTPAITSTDEEYILAIQDLTPKTGAGIIRSFLNSWLLTRSWKYCINFLSESSDTCCDFYIYEVIWSLPTKRYPVPQVTASVFFTIEASRIKPPKSSIVITFVFETERYKFSVKDEIQHEKFLDNIIKSKTMFFKSLTF